MAVCPTSWSSAASSIRFTSWCGTAHRPGGRRGELRDLDQMPVEVGAALAQDLHEHVGALPARRRPAGLSVVEAMVDEASACSIVSASAGIAAVPYEHSTTTPSLASDSALAARSAVRERVVVTDGHEDAELVASMR